jgi:two-component system OmpR family sensor kinase
MSEQPQRAMPKSEAEFAEFLATFAHDMRTPLTSIRGFTDVLIRAGETVSADKREEYLVRIRAAAERLDELISDVSSAANQQP